MRSVIEVERQRAASGLPPSAVHPEATPAPTRRSPADPRRRLGRHADARRFLAEDGGQPSVTPGVWDGLLTALRYHAIQESLASLAAWERQVLHMAFLEGRTNREIAAILSVSRSTVRRRIVLALANLDDQLQRVGTKASAVLLLLLASALARARVVGRWYGSIRATPAGNVILTTAAGAAAGVVVFGAIVGNQGNAAGGHGSTKSPTQATAAAPLLVSAPAAPTSTIGDLGPTQGPHGNTPNAGTSVGTSDQPNSSLDPGCDGNPTNAPPSTPVGPRTAQGRGMSPVTHPQAGGCGPHG